MKLSFNSIILCIKDSEERARKKKQQIQWGFRLSTYKKTAVFLDTSNELLDKEIKKTLIKIKS